MDFAVPGGALPVAAQDPITILAKPSDHIEAFFEDTAGLVEGVDDVYYSNKILIREIGPAKRTTTIVGNDNPAFAVTGVLNNGVNATTVASYGLNATTETTNWVDDRDPAVKIGYDEVNQRITFDGVNSKLGKGTGVGFDTFTVYSKKLDAGENGLGIPALGESPEVDLKQMSYY